jgi:hypothetical protein
MLGTIGIPILAISIGLALFATVIIQQQVYAPRECPGCGTFGKLPGDLIVNIAKAVGNPNEGSKPHFAEFRMQSAQFQ